MANPVSSISRELNAMQELFCVTYVCNGGNATDAATVAGYANPDVVGSRNLTKPHIGQRIRQLVALDITSQLGSLVAIAMQIAHDPLTPPRERLMAIFGLLDRGGLAVPKAGNGGPSVAVQVNVNATATEAQAAIKDIWQSREARENAKALPLASGGQQLGQPDLEAETVEVIEIEREDSGVS